MKHMTVKAAGRKGGSKRSLQKTLAVRENGKKGGRPRLYPPCPKYQNHSHRFVNNRCACEFKR